MSEIQRRRMKKMKTSKMHRPKRYGWRTSLMRPLLFCDRCGEKKQSKLCHEMTQDKSFTCKGDIVKVEEDAEQEKMMKRQFLNFLKWRRTI